MTLITRFAATAVLLTAVAGAQAAAVTNQGTWWGTDGTNGTLRARDIAGNAVALNSASAAFFYDTTLNITWQANMNANGSMRWSDAVTWADGLTTGGFTDWRLPTIIDSGAAGCQSSNTGTDCGYNVQTQVGNAYSEWAHLFYVTLGNLAIVDTNGNSRAGSAGVNWGLTNTAYFTNMRSFGYWSGTEASSSTAWFFRTTGGLQAIGSKNSNSFSAVAVRSGDVLRDGGTVPEPQSLALALTALAGLGLAQRLRRAAGGIGA